jgi:hypothetical protein
MTTSRRICDVRQNGSRTGIETIEQETDRRVTLASDAEPRRATDAELVLLDDVRVGHQSVVKPRRFRSVLVDNL